MDNLYCSVVQSVTTPTCYHTIDQTHLFRPRAEWTKHHFRLQHLIKDYNRIPSSTYHLVL